MKNTWIPIVRNEGHVNLNNVYSIDVKGVSVWATSVSNQPRCIYVGDTEEEARDFASTLIES